MLQQAFVLKNKSSFGATALLCRNLAKKACVTPACYVNNQRDVLFFGVFTLHLACFQKYCYVSLAGAQFDGHPTIQSPAASCYSLFGISHFRWRLQPPPKSSTKIRMLTGSGIRLGLIAVIPSLLAVKFVFLYSNPDVASITKQKTTPVHFYIPKI